VERKYPHINIDILQSYFYAPSHRPGNFLVRYSTLQYNAVQYCTVLYCMYKYKSNRVAHIIAIPNFIHNQCPDGIHVMCKTRWDITTILNFHA
jgi:hypothetical protein